MSESKSKKEWRNPVCTRCCYRTRRILVSRRRVRVSGVLRVHGLQQVRNNPSRERRREAPVRILHLQLQHGASVAQSALADASGALFEVLAAYPLASVTSLLSIVLLSVFFITSADSATFVIAMMTSRGSFSPPAVKKIGWGLIQSSAAAVLLVSGGLEALQRMAILATLPFMFVMLFTMGGLLKALRYEFRYERASRPENRI